MALQLLSLGPEKGMCKCYRAEWGGVGELFPQDVFSEEPQQETPNDILPQTDLSVGVLMVLLRGLGVCGATSMAAAEHFTL